MRLSLENTERPAPESEMNSKQSAQCIGRASLGTAMLPIAATPAATFAAAFATLPAFPLGVLLGCLGDPDSAFVAATEC